MLRQKNSINDSWRCFRLVGLNPGRGPILVCQVQNKSSAGILKQLTKFGNVIISSQVQNLTAT